VRRFAFSYYVAVGLLVFMLYATFLRVAVPPGSGLWCIGVGAGALALILILIAIEVAWKANAHG